ncbi:MAG TPA: hypothetical protein VME44_22980 [Streptosporangiaceae bacterium]|nr:hypothetical protein [Streptosporangiaceae bacterium]
MPTSADGESGWALAPERRWHLEMQHANTQGISLLRGRRPAELYRSVTPAPPSSVLAPGN